MAEEELLSGLPEAMQMLVALSEAATRVVVPDGGNIPYVVIPSGYKLESLERLVFNEHTLLPERLKGTVEVLDPDSFIEYFTLFHDPNSRVFAYEPNITITAVLDYHAALEVAARWCQHRLVLRLRESEGWKVWTLSNNKQFTQMQFAEFLEQNSVDLEKPTPAGIVEIARDLQATTEVEFGSGSRTQDGQVRFKYTETTKATVGAGNLAVPEHFVLSLPVFVGGEEIRLQALLRYRVKEGHLLLWYTLVRPEEARRKAFLLARDTIAEGLSIKIINGNP